jgi:hypothetical protein
MVYWVEIVQINKSTTGVYGFRGSRFHSRPWTALGMHIYEKSVSFDRLNPKIGAKLAIIWKNEYF